MLDDSDFTGNVTDGWSVYDHTGAGAENDKFKVSSTGAYGRMYKDYVGINGAGNKITINLDIDTGNHTNGIEIKLLEMDANNQMLQWVNLATVQNGHFSTVYNTQHQGTVKLRIRIQKPNSQVGTETYFLVDNINITSGELEIMEENNYYPFGLKHQGYNNVITGRDHKYGFGGKEYQEELNLEWYDVSARNYDPALGRWMNIDPLAEQMRRHSPYNFGFDNPVYFQDYDGMMPTGPGDPPIDPITITGSATFVGKNVVNQLDEVCIGCDSNIKTSGTSKGAHVESSEKGERFYGYKSEGKIEIGDTEISGSISGFSAGYEDLDGENITGHKASVYGLEAKVTVKDKNVETTASASVFKAEANSIMALYDGSNGKKGFETGADLGAYVAKGDVKTVYTIPEKIPFTDIKIPVIGGARIGITRGASIYSAHAGYSFGAVTEKGGVKAGMSAHAGFGAGVKYGFSFDTTGMSGKIKK